jgi:phosphoribosylanthranilate isomerase
MWIKICGMTSPAAVEAALEAQVDAIGFVFASSPRELTPAVAATLARPARGRVRCVAVMQHPTQAAVDEVLRIFAPDLLQSDAGDFARLQLPAALDRLAVVREGAALPVPLPARMVFEGPASGRGKVSDWSIAAAIAQVHPFGVDVSSGVEDSPGVKSPAAIARFVAAARAADAVPV